MPTFWLGLRKSGHFLCWTKVLKKGLSKKKNSISRKKDIAEYDIMMSFITSAYAMSRDGIWQLQIVLNQFLPSSLFGSQLQAAVALVGRDTQKNFWKIDCNRKCQHQKKKNWEHKSTLCVVIHAFAAYISSLFCAFLYHESFLIIRQTSQSVWIGVHYISRRRSCKHPWIPMYYSKYMLF